jgi:LuxR family transcriptional regulator, maltose regulon positive regulatory protein
MDHREANGVISGETLMVTKTQPPVLHVDFVSRRGLVRYLRAGVHRKLTLLSAPTGYGKTTLLAEWRAADKEERKFAWLSLDSHDDDPVRFWAHLIEALRIHTPDLGARSLAALEAGADLAKFVLPPLVNELAALPTRIVLVLDDYHHIRQRRCHEGVSFLLAHAPHTLHVAISTRSEPPLPLGMLRARGQMTEIRGEGLRFTGEETSALLNEQLALELTSDDIERLLERTEGWPAGLYLAGLSLRYRDDRSAFIERFAGDNRNVVDYLAEEAVDNQPENIRIFLRRTSILEHFSGSLCDAVLDSEGSTETLRELERWNLFVVPLDERREWYRYHHLFADLLRVELKREEPELIPTLHGRASEWYRDTGIVAEAIRHATLAGDVEGARRLILRHWVSYVNSGQVALVAAWLDALPEEAITADPPLCLVVAWISLFAGNQEETERFLRLAEDGQHDGPLPDGTRSIASGVTLVRAFSVFGAAGQARAREEARRAIELETEESSPWRAVAQMALGYSLYWSGEFSEARAPLEAAVRLGKATTQPLIAVSALSLLSQGEYERAGHDTAEVYAREALTLAEENMLSNAPQVGSAHVALGKALLASDELPGAEAHLERGLELQRGVGRHPEIADTLFALAIVRRGRGDLEGARACIEEGRALVERCAEPGILSSLLQRTERELRRAPRTASESAEELSEREIDVLRLLATELSQREIGEVLYLSFNTVHVHVRSIYRKLGVSSRKEAVEQGRQRGGLSLASGEPAAHAAQSARRRSRSNLARPYMLLLIAFNFVI